MIVNDVNTDSLPASHAKTKKRGILLFLGIILIAANLRPTITGVGPLVGDITHSTGLSNTLAGLLTTLPLLAFTVFSPIAPIIARRIGMERALFLSLAGLVVGTLLRVVGGIAGLFLGMFLVGACVAMGNVLLPALVKRDYPTQIGLMTGVYTTAMSVFAALSSGISVPLANVHGFGWRGSFASWAVLSIVGMLVWLPQLRSRHVPVRTLRRGLWKSILAWQVTMFMGLQSFTFYVSVAWLPQLLQDRGMSTIGSGWMLSWMQFVSLPASFLVPLVAGKRRSQRGLVAATILAFLIGYAGLLWVPHSLTLLWVTLIGIAGGASISLALAFFGLRSRSSDVASNLSGMAQSIGYLLAAAGPIFIGYLHDVTNAWNAPLIVLLIVSFLMLLSGLGAGKDAYVDAP